MNNKLTEDKFDQIWSLKPEGRSKVFVYNKGTKTHDEKQIFRSYRSYLKIPPIEAAMKLPKSYMYDGLEPSVPNCLIEYVKDAWTDDPRYNQMIVNWYEPEDYIEPHRDCDNFMVDDYIIRITSLYPQEGIRRIQFQNVDHDDSFGMDLQDTVYFDKHINRNYRHSVGPGKTRRISITFRMLDDNKLIGLN